MFSLETLYVSSHYAADMFNYSFEWIVQCALKMFSWSQFSTSVSCKIGVIVGADSEVSLRTAILQGPLRIYKTVIIALEAGSQLVQVNNKNWRVMWVKWKA